MDMLDRAVTAIKSGQEVDLNKNPSPGADINLRIPALIPDDYLPDVHTRLILYKRLANVNSLNDLEDLQIEMIDRFGLLPEAAKNLMRVTKLKLIASPLGVSKLEVNKDYGRIEFGDDTQVDPLKIVTLVQTQPQKFRLEGATGLKFYEAMEDADHRIRTTHSVLEQLCA